jgi:hypothetical protein
MKPIITFHGSSDVEFDVKCSTSVLRPQKEVPWIWSLGTRGGLLPLVVHHSLFWAQTISDYVTAIVALRIKRNFVQNNRDEMRILFSFFLDARGLPTKEFSVACVLAEMTSWYRLTALPLHQHVFFLHSVSFTDFVYLISTSPKSLSLANFIIFVVTVKRLPVRTEGHVGKKAEGEM